MEGPLPARAKLDVGVEAVRVDIGLPRPNGHQPERASRLGLFMQQELQVVNRAVTVGGSHVADEAIPEVDEPQVSLLVLARVHAEGPQALVPLFLAPLHEQVQERSELCPGVDDDVLLTVVVEEGEANVCSPRLASDLDLVEMYLTATSYHDVHLSWLGQRYGLRKERLSLRWMARSISPVRRAGS